MSSGEEEVHASDDRRTADGTARRRVCRRRRRDVGCSRAAGSGGGAGRRQKAVSALGAAAGVRTRHEAHGDATAVRAAQLAHSRRLRWTLLETRRKRNNSEVTRKDLNKHFCCGGKAEFLSFNHQSKTSQVFECVFNKLTRFCIAYVHKHIVAEHSTVEYAE